MMSKTTFGAFIRQKRIEKGLTQKELAQQLSISESAVSKWEIARSYPDITMIPDICRVLDVTEKELIDGANDTEYRKMKSEARRYRIISEVYFRGFAGAYLLALLICLICDLAVNHRVSFTFTVFGSLLVAFSLIPSWIRFTENHKLAVFVGSVYVSIITLFLICCLRYHQTWFGIASMGVLLGFAVVALPFLLRRYLPEKMMKFILLFYFGADYALLLLLLRIIRITVEFPLEKAVIIVLYTMIPFVVMSVIHIFKGSRLVKASIDVIAMGLMCFGAQAVIDRLFGGGQEDYYRVNFNDWHSCVNGNIMMLLLIVTAVVAAALMVAGMMKQRKGKK